MNYIVSSLLQMYVLVSFHICVQLQKKLGVFIEEC